MEETSQNMTSLLCCKKLTSLKKNQDNLECDIIAVIWIADRTSLEKEPGYYVTVQPWIVDKTS